MQKFLWFFLCLTIPAWSSEMCLKEKLSCAPIGSYLVVEQNKVCTLLNVHDRKEKTIVIEEVTVPSASGAKHSIGWKEWFEKGAPGHTSWIISQINLETGAFEETFSFTHRGWIDMTDSNPFLTTLMNLRFHEVPTETRRRVGLPPGHHKVDNRPIWNPRLIVAGTLIPRVPFLAYKARWPCDGTELSRKLIEIYIPDTPTCDADLKYPTYFPYWLEVEGKIGSAKVRVIDSGTDAHSPKNDLRKCAFQRAL